MNQFIKFLAFSAILLFNHTLSFSQIISGYIEDELDNALIAALVSIPALGEESLTNSQGKFRIFDIQPGQYELVIESDDARKVMNIVMEEGSNLDLGIIKLTLRSVEQEETSDLAIISLSETDLVSDESNEEVSSILSAGRDAFLATAAFQFGTARFRTRGLDSEHGYLYLNGIPFNELENGRLFFGQWGGLNDVFRNIHNNYGLSASEYSIGGLLGTSNINLRAGSQRKQTRLSYAFSNRSYNHRIMLTHSTGFNDKGWAFSFSGSRRVATEGYTPGSFYDAWAGFIGIEKKVNNSHSFHLTAMAAPNKRGKGGASLQELVDITGDRFYNPYWGFQNGKKRNSRVAQAFQPVFMLGHDWNINGEKTVLRTGVSYQSGRNGSTALNWTDVANPAGDFHQKLPTRIQNEDVRNQVLEVLQSRPEYFQVNWDYMYEANRGNMQTIENADGIDGNSVSGIRANYIVEERRYDSKEFNFNTILTHSFSNRNTLNGGLTYQQYNGHTFALVDDLLGADYYLDIDKFADMGSAPNTVQKDLNVTNNVVREGEVYNYDFNSTIQKSTFWLQENISLRKLDFFLGGELNRSTFWRTGNMRNGYYPESSFGDSEKQNFNNYKVKGGLTYKFSGRQYAWASGYISTKAPYFRNAYANVRNTDVLVPKLSETKEKSAEVGLAYKSPVLGLKAVGYFTDIDDETEIVFFFSDQDFTINDSQRTGAFGSFINHNIDKRHVGLELAAEIRLNTRFSLKAVAALGQHIYDSRWEQYALADEVGYFRNGITVYTNQFFVESSPQTAYNLELKYDSPNYWFASINANFFGNRYLDFSPDRRIESTTESFDANSAELRDVVIQEKVANAFTLDFFAYKSFKFRNHFIYLTANVSNILDNENFITGGYEQLRFDATRGKDFFAPKYYYGYGRNFFLGIAFKL